MGNGASKDNATKQIDERLRKEQLNSSNQIRLLLLGSGESGKSTLVRQMKILKTEGYSDTERDYFRNHICFNLVEWTLLLGEKIGRDLVESPISRTPSTHADTTVCQVTAEMSPSGGILSDDIRLLRKWHAEQTHELKFTSEVTQAVRVILNTPDGDKRVGALLHLPDSAPYLFEHAERIMDDNYVPTVEDIVRCRIVTNGVHELHFNDGKHAFTIIDVGGQRGQRKKWIHAFDNISGIIFVTGLSDYDKNLDEDGVTNRLQDSLALWEEVVRYHAFKDLTTMLFFNKTDKFEEKILRIPLTVCFPDFQSKGDPVTSAKEYIEKTFLSKVSQEKRVFAHFTTATDKSNIHRVMQMTMDIALDKSADSVGI